MKFSPVTNTTCLEIPHFYWQWGDLSRQVSLSINTQLCSIHHTLEYRRSSGGVTIRPILPPDSFRQRTKLWPFKMYLARLYGICFSLKTIILVDLLTVCTVIIPSVGTTVADPTVTPVVGRSGQRVAVSTILTRILWTVGWNIMVLPCSVWDLCLNVCDG